MILDTAQTQEESNAARTPFQMLSGKKKSWQIEKQSEKGPGSINELESESLQTTIVVGSKENGGPPLGM